MKAQPLKGIAKELGVKIGHCHSIKKKFNIEAVLNKQQFNNKLYHIEDFLMVYEPKKTPFKDTMYLIQANDYYESKSNYFNEWQISQLLLQY
jgi:hypothetical protein